jgi:hypothetical protein
MVVGDGDAPLVHHTRARNATSLHRDVSGARISAVTLQKKNQDGDQTSNNLPEDPSRRLFLRVLGMFGCYLSPD